MNDETWLGTLVANKDMIFVGCSMIIGSDSNTAPDIAGTKKICMIYIID